MAGRFLSLKDAPFFRRRIVNENNFGVNSQSEREWWYLSGFFWENSKDAYTLWDRPPDFGIHLAFFHSYEDTPGDNYELLTGNASLTDVKNGKYYCNTNSLQFPSIYGEEVVSKNKLNIKLNKWFLRMHTHKKWMLSFYIEGYKIDLNLNIPNQLWLHGKEGMYKRDKHYTFYYSIPFIAAEGNITDLLDNGERKIRGNLWYDHEIGAKGEGRGWEWFSLRFADKTAYMLYFFSGKGGKSEPLVEKYYTLEDNQAQKTSILRDVKLYIRERVKLKSGYSYPTKFEVFYNDDSTKKPGRFIVNSMASEQEFYAADIKNKTRYWEGLVGCEKIEGKNKTGGYGYVEIKASW